MKERDWIDCESEDALKQAIGYEDTMCVEIMKKKYHVENKTHRKYGKKKT
jgi:hypothetical protein